MPNPKSIALVDIIKRSGFFQKGDDGEPKSTNPAIACVINRDFLRELASYVRDCEDVNIAYAAILEVANFHAGDDPRGGIIWD